MADKRIKYPVGLQDFEGLRKDGYLYVDKTEILYQLINSGKYFFLSRPRRFGKSLMLSTLKAFFEGKKDLFDGLAIHDLEKEWKKHPVLLLELSRTNSNDIRSLDGIIDQQFRQWEDLYGIKEKSDNPASRFADIIIAAHKATGQRVVVLVDEYDNPLINTMKNQEIHDHNHSLLKSVYSNLKSLDAYIKFGMLTGVTRFSKLSVFSGLNNLTDITLYPEFAAICGITESELLINIEQGIDRLADRNGWDKGKTVSELKKYYDGYHFTQDCPDIYNPFSILSAMSALRINNYWFMTGIPSFLVERMKEGDVELEKLMNPKVEEAVLKEIDSARNSTLATLFQAGFLTIKGYDERRNQYLLGIPNEEVREGMSTLFMEYFLYPDYSEGKNIIYDLIDLAEEGRPEDFLKTLQSFFAGVPFDMSKGSREVYFHNAFYIISTLIGLKTKSEHHTSGGSIDLLIETDGFVYLMEFKLDKSAEEALAQIDEREYALQFAASDKKVFKIGINFSSEKRNIDSWLITK